MSWRKYENHKEETKAVKKALQDAGINASVGHGTGSAWSWLEINIGERQGKHIKADGEYSSCVANCPVCIKGHELDNRVMKIAQEITGRCGEHHGEILVFMQDYWDKKLKKHIPILQEDEK